MSFDDLLTANLMLTYHIRLQQDAEEKAAIQAQREADARGRQ